MPTDATSDQLLQEQNEGGDFSISEPAPTLQDAESAEEPQLEKVQESSSSPIDRRATGLSTELSSMVVEANPQQSPAEVVGKDAGSSSRTKARLPAQSLCAICAENRKSCEMMRINWTCCHSFCSSCVSKHVMTRVTDNHVTVPCPGLDCKHEVEFHACVGLLPRNVMDAWDKALCEALIPDVQKFYCPFRDCSAMLVNDGGKVMEECECPHCHRMFCAPCRVPWHAGVTCKDFQELNEDERGSADLMVRKLADEKKWTRCPQCKFFVERTQGCPHMVCRCRFEFCYGCGAEWTQTHGGCSRS